MTTSDLINLIAAILVGGGTLALAIMTWKSIRQTRGIQKNEKRDRLLNDIIEWAVDINKCGWERELSMPVGVPQERYELYWVYQDINLLSKFRAADAKSEYIGSIASAFGEDLTSAFDNVKKQLDKLLALRWKRLKSKKAEEEEKLSEEIVETERKLHKFAEALGRVAAKIRTREIA